LKRQTPPIALLDETQRCDGAQSPSTWHVHRWSLVQLNNHEQSESR
jgi:hypothetical protein